MDGFRMFQTHMMDYRDRFVLKGKKEKHKKLQIFKNRAQ